VSEILCVFVNFYSKLLSLLNVRRKSIEKKRKEVEGKEQKIGELNQQLNKRKEQMDQLEKSLQKAGGSAAASTELSKRLADTQQQLEM
jgi:septal ring factor EnvC (AmiA/AmiB activator)